MRTILIAASASLAAFAVAMPAQAESSGNRALVGVPSVHVHRGGGNFGDFRHDFDRRRDHGVDDGVLYYDREYQGDTLWRRNSFNDWWHEQPDRAFPRWVANNQNCQRLWWSGGNWRC